MDGFKTVSVLVGTVTALYELSQLTTIDDEVVAYTPYWVWALGCLVIICVIWGYLGGFDPVTFVEEDVGPLYFIYREYVGPEYQLYSRVINDVIKTLSAVKNLPVTTACAMHFDHLASSKVHTKATTPSHPSNSDGHKNPQSIRGNAASYSTHRDPYDTRASRSTATPANISNNKHRSTSPQRISNRHRKRAFSRPQIGTLNTQNTSYSSSVPHEIKEDSPHRGSDLPPHPRRRVLNSPPEPSNSSSSSKNSSIPPKSLKSRLARLKRKGSRSQTESNGLHSDIVSTQDNSSSSTKKSRRFSLHRAKTSPAIGRHARVHSETLGTPQRSMRSVPVAPTSRSKTLKKSFSLRRLGKKNGHANKNGVSENHATTDIRERVSGDHNFHSHHPDKSYIPPPISVAPRGALQPLQNKNLNSHRNTSLQHNSSHFSLHRNSPLPIEQHYSLGGVVCPSNYLDVSMGGKFHRFCVSNGLKVKLIDARCWISKFPLKNRFSYILAPYRIYSSPRDFKLPTDVVMEFYNHAERTITFAFPRSNLDAFQKPSKLTRERENQREMFDRMETQAVENRKNVSLD